MGKVCCGPFMGKPRWVIGWAMVGRAEFAYFIAIMANSTKMMGDKLFAILVWALIYATIFAPLIFRKVLTNYMKSEGLVSDQKKPTFNDASRLSGHLPDLEQEQLDADEAKMQEEFGVMKEKLQAKEEELKRIENDTGLRHVANAPTPQIGTLMTELAAKNKEIAELTEKLAAVECPEMI